MLRVNFPARLFEKRKLAFYAGTEVSAKDTTSFQHHNMLATLPAAALLLLRHTGTRIYFPVDGLPMPTIGINLHLYAAHTI